MDYQTYKPEDFARDLFFRAWVLYPDQENTSFWETWMLENPGKVGEVAHARLLVLAFKEPENIFSERDELALQKRIAASAEKFYRENSVQKEGADRKSTTRQVDYVPQQNAPAHKNYWWAAAMIALAIMAFASWGLFGDRDINQTDGPVVADMLEKKVPKGQKLKLRLTDGTLVALNAGSMLRYPAKFTGGTRDVYLEGEAFFEVAHDTDRPFSVHTKGLSTKVLGTAFNVKAYPGEKVQQVALLEGKVSLHLPATENIVALSPGEQAEFYEDGGKITVGQIKNPASLLWREGVLVFEDIPVKEAFRQLENWYGVVFEANKPFPHKHISGRFDNETLENVLQSISFSIKFNYKIKDGRVDLQF